MFNIRSGWWLLVLLASFAVAQGASAEQTLERKSLPPWQVPDIDRLPDDSASREIRLGRELIIHTSALIGPDASDASRRFAGNGLECGSCHLDAGTQRYGLPYVGIYGLYPRFSARVGAEQTLADRINDCMQRSMNGRALPPTDAALLAIVAYMRFLSADQPAGVAPIGRGAPKLPLPTAAANPVNGDRVYRDRCATCHRPDGQGVRLSPEDESVERRRYLFPPLWGADSYNDGAGMARVITAAWFVHANMPRGIEFDYPLISVESAYDVAAFINSHSRPHLATLKNDYPDLWLKPVDASYPPFQGPFSLNQHRYGPWPSILQWIKTNRPRSEDEPYAANDLEQSVSETSGQGEPSSSVTAGHP